MKGNGQWNEITVTLEVRDCWITDNVSSPFEYYCTHNVMFNMLIQITHTYVAKVGFMIWNLLFYYTRLIFFILKHLEKNICVVCWIYFVVSFTRLVICNFWSLIRLPHILLIHSHQNRKRENTMKCLLRDWRVLKSLSVKT